MNRGVPVVASGASDRKDSTRRYGRRLLRCGISTRLMTAVGQGRPDSFASTLKVRRSAVGSGSGRHETARPMSQLGGYLPLAPGVSTVRYPIPQRTFKYVATVQSVTDETCQ
jgi:hypothetical protein